MKGVIVMFCVSMSVVMSILAFIVGELNQGGTANTLTSISLICLAISIILFIVEKEEK